MELKDFLIGLALGISLISAVTSGFNSARIASANADALAAQEFVRKADPVVSDIDKRLKVQEMNIKDLGQIFTTYAQLDNKPVVDSIIAEYVKAIQNAKNGTK